MKTTLHLAFLICFFSFAQKGFSQSLYVTDPEGWGSDPATIEEASLTIKPKGVYMEYGLYLTISAKGSYYYGNATPPLEIIMSFCLPVGSIVHDSWLWVGNDIMQAILIDRAIATQIYEGIVDRRKDPSILTKNGNGCYDLRVYPLAGDGTRKLKITYLVPTRWTRNLVSAPLPLSLLRASNTIPDLNITIHTDSTFQNPIINELGFLPYIDNLGGGVYGAKIPASMMESYSSLELSYSSPLQNGLFSCAYPVDSLHGYYQMVFHPQQVLQIAEPKKVAILLEIDSEESNVEKAELFAKTREMVTEYFQPADSFNVFYMTASGVQRLSANWLPATPVSIQSAFSVVPTGWKTVTTVTNIVSEAVSFVRTSGNNGEVLLISDNDNYLSAGAANQMISSIVAGTTPADIAVHVMNYAGGSGNYYNGYYSHMDYLYQNLTVQTGGNYIKHQFSNAYEYWDWEWGNYYYYYSATSTFSELMHASFASFDAVPQNYSLQVDADNGFCYAEMELSKNNLSAGQAAIFVGKYYGSGPLRVNYDALQNDSLIWYNAQLQSYPGDSLTRKMWAGSYISEMESDIQNNATRWAIIDTSMANRVLSLHTAFLALEPNDTLAACENCGDDSGNNGGGNNGGVSVPGIDSALATISAAPNPFYGTITITISGETKDLESAELKIYNMMGQEVKVFKDLHSGSREEITLVWNGEDENGNSVPNGVYLAVFQASNGNQIVKLVKAG